MSPFNHYNIMKYLEISFSTTPCNETVNDVLSALAGDIGFESFVEYDNGIKGYIQESNFDEKALKESIANFPVEETKVSYEIKPMEDKNWNEEWEKNYFRPIVIGNRCVIHSTFHQDVPKAEYEILINPQMAFGTGHHETTSLIIEQLLEADLKDKSLLDMGCGTSILAILASMRGAGPVTAIDIDTWCVENSKDNILLNGTDKITVELGDASSLKEKEPFDIIIANINRNILLDDLKHYAACMKQGSEIFMSGFYAEDIPYIRNEAEKQGLQYLLHTEKNNWAAVKFVMK